MACLDETTVVAFVGGTLAATSATEVEAHLASCSDCRLLVSELARSSVELEGGGQSDAGSAPTIATPSVPARAGLVLAGRFVLERIVGEGGIGTVWTATHLPSRKQVAIKLIKGPSSARERRRMLREARAANAVVHASVLPVDEVLELEDGSPALVMELLVGESLRRRLDRAPERRLSLDETARLLLPVASAVAAAHAVGVVHRDLKPDNIFLVERAGATDVRVLDFGIAKLTAADSDPTHSASITQTGDVLGTPYYMSPEQAYGESDIDERTDLWAMGVILYECLSGKRPFVGANLGQIIKSLTTGQRTPLVQLVPSLPTAVCALVERLLTVDRAARPRGLSELCAVLAGGAAGLPAGRTDGDKREGEREPERWRPAQWTPRRRALLALGVVLVLAPPVVATVMHQRRAALAANSSTAQPHPTATATPAATTTPPTTATVTPAAATTTAATATTATEGATTATPLPTAHSSVAGGEGLPASPVPSNATGARALPSVRRHLPAGGAARAPASPSPGSPSLSASPEASRAPGSRDAASPSLPGGVVEKVPF